MADLAVSQSAEKRDPSAAWSGVTLATRHTSGVARVVRKPEGMSGRDCLVTLDHGHAARRVKVGELAAAAFDHAAVLLAWVRAEDLPAQLVPHL